MIRFLFTLFLIFFTIESFLKESFGRTDLIPGSRYTSGRASGMADAYLPLADDVASGLFYNPAGLARIRRIQVVPLNMSFYLNNEYIKNSNLNFYNFSNLNSYLPNLQSIPSSFQGMGGALLPTFGVPGFSFGVLVQAEVGAMVSADGSSLTYRSQYQLIPAIGTGFRLLNGVLRVGYSLQWVNQASGPEFGSTVTVPLSQSDSFSYSHSLSQGSGLSHMLGVGIVLPMEYLPSFHCVVRNVGQTKYNSFSLIQVTPSPSSVPNLEDATVDLSFSLQPKLGGGVGLNLVLEGRDITNQSGAVLTPHIAIGGELFFRNNLFFRGGWNGYPSVGMGLKSREAELSLSWYSAEIGSQYLSQRDIRYLFQYQIGKF